MRNNADKDFFSFSFFVYMLELNNKRGITARKIEQRKKDG